MLAWTLTLVQPNFEPMQPEQQALFIDMLYGKDPRFVQRAVGLMVSWERTTVPTGITHIHGELDKTLPIERTMPDYCIRGEGHMLTYSRPELVEEVLASW